MGQTLDVVALRREIHAEPELGFLEFRTAARVASALEAFGYQLLLGEQAMDPGQRLGVPGAESVANELRAAQADGLEPRWASAFAGGMTAVVGVLEGNRPGPTLAFRFDMDALPVLELGSDDHLPRRHGFASRREGQMHACGHDGHTAIGLVLAQRLADRDFAGRVKLVFQPAEELLGGGRGVAASGVLDDVDELYCLHLGLGVPTGTVHTATDGFLASSRIRASFKGRAAHAGLSPESGANALLAAAHAVTQLQALPQYAGPGTRLNVGAFHSGTATNVIAELAEIELETRAPSAAVEERLREAALETIRSAGRGLGVAVEAEVFGSAGPVINDEVAAARVAAAASSVEGLEVASEPNRTSVSEDASWLLDRVREAGGVGTYMTIGSDSPGGHHQPNFDVDERALPLAVELLTALARGGAPPARYSAPQAGSR